MKNFTGNTEAIAREYEANSRKELEKEALEALIDELYWNICLVLKKYPNVTTDWLKCKIAKVAKDIGCDDPKVVALAYEMIISVKQAGEEVRL